jgi:hypothetical protein
MPSKIEVTLEVDSHFPTPLFSGHFQQQEPALQYPIVDRNIHVSKYYKRPLHPMLRCDRPGDVAPDRDSFAVQLLSPLRIPETSSLCFHTRKSKENPGGNALQLAHNNTARSPPNSNRHGKLQPLPRPERATPSLLPSNHFFRHTRYKLYYSYIMISQGEVSDLS